MTASQSATPHVALDGVAILDQLPIAAALVDALGQLVWVNETTQRLFGYRADELVGTNILDYIDVEWNPMVLDSIVYALDNAGVRLPTLYRIRTKDGTLRVVEVTANNQLENPAIAGLVVLLRVWEEQQLHDEILESLGRGDDLDHMLRLLIAMAAQDTLQAAASVYRHTEDGAPLVSIASSPAVPTVSAFDAGIVGSRAVAPWTQAAAKGTPVLCADLTALTPRIAEAAAATGHQACWAYPVHRQGTTEVVAVITLWLTRTGYPEPTADWMIRRMVQLTSLAMAQTERSAQLEHAAHHDLLTDLPNRARFFALLEEQLRTGVGRVGVLYVDLDGFKAVNDTHGHASGDDVLEEVATRLICATRSTDLVARLGGDEFAVLCPGASDEGLVATAERLIASIQDPIGTGPSELFVGASVGIAATDAGSCSSDVLVERADAALLLAKAAGKGTYRVG